MNNEMLATIDDESLVAVTGGTTIGGVIGGAIDGTIALADKLLHAGLSIVGGLLSGAGDLLSSIGGALKG